MSEKKRSRLVFSGLVDSEENIESPEDLKEEKSVLSLKASETKVIAQDDEEEDDLSFLDDEEEEEEAFNPLEELAPKDDEEDDLGFLDDEEEEEFNPLEELTPKDEEEEEAKDLFQQLEEEEEAERAEEDKAPAAPPEVSDEEMERLLLEDDEEEETPEEDDEEEKVVLLPKEVDKQEVDPKALKKAEKELRKQTEENEQIDADNTQLFKDLAEKEKLEKEELDKIRTKKRKSISDALKIVSANFPEAKLRKAGLGGVKRDSRLAENGILIESPSSSQLRPGQMIALYPYLIKEAPQITTKIKGLQPVYDKLNQMLAGGREQVQETVSKENKPIYAFVDEVQGDAFSLIMFKNLSRILSAGSNLDFNLLVKILKSGAATKTNLLPMDILAYSGFNRIGKRPKVSDFVQKEILKNPGPRPLRSFLVLDYGTYKKLQKFDPSSS